MEAESDKKKKKQQQQQLSWKIKVHARSNSRRFQIKLKAEAATAKTATLPTWTCNFYRLSIFLKLHNYFLLHLKSHSHPQSPSTFSPPTLKSRLLAAFHRLRRRPRPRPVKIPNPETGSPINRLKRFNYEEPFKMSSLVVGILAFQIQTLYAILLYFAKLFRKYVTGKKSTTALAFSVTGIAAAAVFCLLLGFRLNTVMNSSYQGYIADFVFKAVNYIIF